MAITKKQAIMRAVRNVAKECVYCNAVAHHSDHIVAVSLGAVDCASNLVPACASCNCSKGARILGNEDFMKAKIHAFINKPQVELEAMRLLQSSNKPEDVELKFITSANYV